MQPLHIRIELGSPLAGFQARPLYLDGLLTGLRAELFERAVDEVEGNPWELALELDDYLDSFEAGGKRIWKASQLFPCWTETGQWLIKTRKTDPMLYMEAQDRGLLKARRNYTDVNSGQERNHFIHMPIRWASHIDSWCIGDMDELAHLLGNLRSIGRERRNGFGVVKGVTVSPADVAEQKWRWRVLPEGAEAEYDVSLSYVPSFESVCPPYWDQLNRIRCSVPVVI